MFPRLIYLKKLTFPSVETTVDTLIDARKETSLLKISKIKYITLLSDANVPVRFRAQQRAKYS